MRPPFTGVKNEKRKRPYNVQYVHTSLEPKNKESVKAFDRHRETDRQTDRRNTERSTQN